MMSDQIPIINPLNEDGTPKTAKQLEKEAKKAAKLAKFNEKKAKVAFGSSDASKQVDKAKPKKPVKTEEKKVVTYDLDTPAGEKKDVSVDLPSQYSPSYVEAAWYDWWKKKGFFKPEYGRDLSQPNPAGQFVMVIPPPNVTGSLHVGHALTNSVEDAITRWHRMKGRTTLWVPGCDHAGIATQVAVEKKIKRDENKSRHDLGREEFVKRVWQWKKEKGGRIYEQLERMGSSLDWDRACFTMDSGPQAAVQESFLRLHEDGTIYRANRLVNWSCSLKSAISDIEVEKRELPGRTELSVPGYPKKVQFGVLVSFSYPVQGSEEKLTVATTRIETMLGDTAVAVHPEDSRYTHLHGGSVVHPITGRVLPIVTDTFVEMEFGTGAVKITPAHDPNDYEVGKRHDLPFLIILTNDGYIVEGYGEFSGQHRFECRETLQAKLTELGCYVDTKDNPMVVPICSRSKDIVEPMLRPQWYVKCADMAADAMAVVSSGELELIPKMHEKTWYHWMGDIRDWCISRQLWWGHRIPAYYVTLQGENTQSGVEDASRWVCAASEAAARTKAAAQFGVAEDSITLQQDPDVLDTWYSSALFPFSVMGWPNKTRDLELFYPGTLLETGHDIIFFWVARMVFFGRKLMGKLPFKQVYLHAMVRDSHGRKMSKSLGNVIDPMDVIQGITLQELHQQLDENSNLDPREVDKAKAGQKADYPKGIPECGTDALRFALCAYTSQGRDINLDVLRVNGYRNFCNKLWNATKFAMMNLAPPFSPHASLQQLKQQVLLVRRKTDATSNSNGCCGADRRGSNRAWLAALDQHLSTVSYVGGHQPSQSDVRVAAMVNQCQGCFTNNTSSSIGTRNICNDNNDSSNRCSNDRSSGSRDPLPHLQRWRRHMASYSCSERTALKDTGTAPIEDTINSSNSDHVQQQASHAESGLTVVDRWMLSQLAVAVRDCNAGFQEYNFPQVTSALHSLWWYSICDTYLECTKPRLYGKPGPDRTAAQQVLWTSLHTGLRLISPLMPFLSEELFQRLPAPAGVTPPESVCVAPYPETSDYAMFIDEEAEEQFKLAQRVISEVRSAKSKYDIPSKTKIELSLMSESAGTLSSLESLTRDIATLSIASSVTVTDQQPTGAVPTPVGGECVAWMKLKGLVDLTKCQERLQKKLSECQSKLMSLRADMAKEQYAKVPEDIQEKNKERAQELVAEEEQNTDALAQLAAMSRE